MALIVQKYGGTSVGSTERIRNVAKRVAKWKAAGHDLIVVPSAMAGETNRLIALAHEIQAHPDPRPRLERTIGRNHARCWRNVDRWMVPSRTLCQYSNSLPDCQSN